MIKKKLKLYRGYVSLAVVSVYGAFNYTGVVGSNINVDFESYGDLSDDAAAFLSRIESADIALRKAIHKLEPTWGSIEPKTETKGHIENSEYNKTLPTVYKLHRVLLVMQTAIASERPTFGRSRSIFSSLIKSLSPDLNNADSVLQFGAKVIAKSLTLKAFGNAYLIDVRRHIENKITPPSKK